MACTLTVPFWPTSYDNLHWSKDNQIAVLGGEHILILTPRLHEPNPSHLWWDTENLIRINAFTEPELPRSAVLTDRNTSIGEESSIFHAHAAAWSSPGLARHGGSALAVLTTNHVLSLWAPEPLAKGVAVWQRTLVINHAIRQFYHEQHGMPSDGDGRESEEALQIQQRVRSFAWTQPVHSDLERPHPDLFSGLHHLVVATEGGHILVLGITSPYCDPTNKHSTWQAIISESLYITDLTQSLYLEDTNGLRHPQSTIAMPRPSGVDYVGPEHIAVGEWHSGRSDHKRAAAVVFILEGRLYITSLLHDADGNTSFTSGLKPSVSWHLRDRVDLRGPLKVTPGIDAGALVVFGINAVFHGQLMFNDIKTSLSVDFSDHHLDDRWDDVTGVTITNSADGNALLHVVSHLSSSTAPTHALQLPLAPGRDAPGQPAWQFALNDSKEAYAATNDLGNHVQERTWGIACAPVNGYTAVCASMHPNDVIAYIINADQASILNITLESEARADDFRLAPAEVDSFSGLPSSTILFFLKRYLEQKVDRETAPQDEHDTLVRHVQNMLSPGHGVGFKSLVRASDSNAILLYKTRISLFANAAVRRVQATRICNLAGSDHALQPEGMTTMIRHVAEVVFSISRDDVEFDDMSMNIRRVYEIAVSKLDANYRPGDREASATAWREQCKICHQSIIFESFKWARCQQGHQFSRCALSLLANQEPATTKECSVCGLHYLDETVVDGFRTVPQDLHMVGLNGEVNSQEENAVSKMTMAELLFKACHVCLYCGGKFGD